MRRTFWGICGLSAGFVLFACTTAPEDLASSTSEALRRPAPDPLGLGPLPTTVTEYKLPSARQPEVLDGRDTEIWAAVYRPSTLEAGRSYPLVVLLHGNHGTCGRGTNPRIDDSVRYTTSGTCPRGYTVTPNHLGYAYFAERLASRGYLVASINANLGITSGTGVRGDNGLNLARGRLVLKHLETLAKWNAGTEATPASLGADLKGHVDLGHVGFMGHSRGGEGVRAAYNLYRDPGSPWPAKIGRLVVEGILEIGPVDGQTSRVLDADGTAWNVVLPMCDGDVSDLQGMQPFDRMLAMSTETKATPKSMFAVWGANHNFFNTEWQENDSDGCEGHTPLWNASDRTGSAKQRTTGIAAAVAFFGGNVGAAAERPLAALFSPDYGISTSVDPVSTFERAYIDFVSPALEDFSNDAGKNNEGLAITTSSVTADRCAMDEHSALVECISWTSAGATTYYEVPIRTGDVDMSTSGALSFRAGRQDGRNPSGSTNFHVSLVDSRGAVSGAVAITDYLSLVGPMGHVTLPTARISFDAFTGIDRAHVKSLRLTFDDTTRGAVYLGDIRRSEVTAIAPLPPLVTLPIPVIEAGGDFTRTISEGNRIAGVHEQPDGSVVLEVQTDAGFGVANALFVATIGDAKSDVSEYRSDDTRALAFTFPRGTLHVAGANVVVARGRTHWALGRLR